MKTTFEVITELYHKKVRGVASEEELLKLDFLMRTSCMNENLLLIKLEQNVKK